MSTGPQTGIQRYGSHTSGLNLKRAQSASSDQSKKRPPSEEKVTRPPAPLSQKTSISSDRKSQKTPPVKTVGKSARKSCKIEYLEGLEAVPFLIQAVQKEREILESLNCERMNFEKVYKAISTGQDGFANWCEPVRKKHSYFNFDDTYDNYLKDIFQIWVAFFYFVSNVRITFIKILNKAGTVEFTPNAKLERAIIMQALDFVKLYSTLKIKFLPEALKRLRFDEDFIKSEMSLSDYERKISSSFMCDMEILEENVRDIVSSVKKANEKLARESTKCHDDR